MNKSGISPSGNRVLILPDKIDEVTPGGIHVPDSIKEKHLHAQATGTVIAVGPDCWRDEITLVERLIDNEWKTVERRISGYSESFAHVGEKVAFAKYGGLMVEGEDGVNYRIMNDTDITARVSDNVSFTDIKSRQRLGGQ